MEFSRPGYGWVVDLYDRLFRFWHALDTPAAMVGPVLRIEISRNRRTRRLSDGTTLQRGAAVCIIHLNNDHVRSLHAECDSPVRVGLEFRRQLVASLRELARLAAPGGRLCAVQALSATTIFHQGLRRLGFEPGPDRLWWPKMVAIYQRALLASLHPAGRLRLRRSTYRRAERLWMSRDRLMRLYHDAGAVRLSRDAAFALPRAVARPRRGHEVGTSAALALSRRP